MAPPRNATIQEPGKAAVAHRRATPPRRWTGTKMRALRSALGITQEQMADLCKVNAQTYSAGERDTRQEPVSYEHRLDLIERSIRDGQLPWNMLMGSQARDRLEPGDTRWHFDDDGCVFIQIGEVRHGLFIVSAETRIKVQAFAEMAKMVIASSMTYYEREARNATQMLAAIGGK